MRQHVDAQSVFYFKRFQPLFFLLDDDRHAHPGILLLESDDVLVAQAYASLAGAPWHRVLVVSAAMDANAMMPRGDQSQEPSAVGEEARSRECACHLPSPFVPC